MRTLRFHSVTFCFLAIFGIVLLCTSTPVTAITVLYDETTDGDLPPPSHPRADTFWIGDLDLGINTIAGTLSRSDGASDDTWDAFLVTLPCGLLIDYVEVFISNFNTMDIGTGGGEIDYHQIGTTLIYTYIFSGDATFNLPNIFPTNVPTDYQFDIFPRFRSSFDWEVKVHVSSSGDSDCDGIPDTEDACLDSDLGASVAIDDCDSNVDNELLDNGCTLADLVAECAEGVRNHGEWVNCVAHLTRDLKKSGILNGREKGAIQSCAGQADIP